MHDVPKEEFCLNQVREFEREMFAASLFLPDRFRKHVLALRSFNVETLMIKEQTTSSLVGRMRVTWWREALDQAYAGNPPAHPTVAMLADAIREGNLTRRYFDRILERREDDLEVVQPADLESMLDYVEATSSSLLYLSLEAAGCGGEEHPQAEQAAQHIGQAVGLVTLLRGLPYGVSQGTLNIPRTVCSAHGLHHNELAQMVAGDIPVNDACKSAVKEIASLAADQLAAGRALMPHVPDVGRRVLLPSMIADTYLYRLAKAEFDPCRETLLTGLADLRFNLWLGWKAKRNSY